MADYLAFNEECWSRLTDNVIKGNYVLVIGNEAVLDKEMVGCISKTRRMPPVLFGIKINF